jgi:hypothetical protein
LGVFSSQLSLLLLPPRKHSSHVRVPLLPVVSTHLYFGVCGLLCHLAL